MTYGTSTRHLDFPGANLKHKFVLADVTRPLLGADFFDAHGLCVDFEGKRIFRLVDNRVVYSIPATLTTADPASSNQVVKAAGAYQDLLQEFPEVQQPRFGTHRNAHGVAHAVPTRGPPFLPKLVTSVRRDSPVRARPSTSFLQTESYGDPTARGRPHSTWCPSPTGRGARVVISAASTTPRKTTVIPCRIFKISVPIFTAMRSFWCWICSTGTTRSRWICLLYTSDAADE